MGRTPRTLLLPGGSQSRRAALRGIDQEHIQGSAHAWHAGCVCLLDRPETQEFLEQMGM